MSESIPNGVYWVPLNPLTCRSDGYFADENGNLVEGTNRVKADEFYKKWHPCRFLFPTKKSGIAKVSHEGENKSARPTLDSLVQLLHEAALQESGRLGQLIDHMKPNPTMSYDETLSYIAKMSKLTSDLRYVLDGNENEMAF